MYQVVVDWLLVCVSEIKSKYGDTAHDKSICFSNQIGVDSCHLPHMYKHQPCVIAMIRKNLARLSRWERVVVLNIEKKRKRTT